jgi:hypothetical protein
MLRIRPQTDVEITAESMTIEKFVNNREKRSQSTEGQEKNEFLFSNANEAQQRSDGIFCRFRISKQLTALKLSMLLTERSERHN